ncbi:MAG TPA: DNA polymerase III subunit beta [Candidatus Limnocylindrales bacterium]|nr:DNA polymerase III subunit beta [Candidatus Limnocylindrales bacterium]
MKINILTINIQNKLSFINHAISLKSQIPILLNVLLETQDGSLKISSTDLEIGIEVFVPATIEEEGSITVPAKTFIELISSISEETITLETDKETLTVKSKKTKSLFQTIKSDEFPKLYKEKGEKLVTLQEEEIQKDFSSVIFAAATDTTRPALSGVLVKNEESGFLLVATDGYRLSLKHHKTLSKSTASNNIIVPARVFKELMSIKEESHDIEVFTSVESSQVIFSQGKTTLIGRLIEGAFPNYEKIIPTDFSTSAEFDREEMQKAVKICSIFARDSANIIKLSLKKDHIVVSSQSPSIGENTVTVEGILKGEENEIAFNARYLQDLLSGLSNNEMVFEMTGPLNPGVFKIKDDISYLHLIMPVRVQG